MNKPLVQAFLQCFNRFVEVLAKGNPKKLIQHGPVESLNESVGPGGVDLGTSVLDVVERQVQFKGMVVRAAEFAAIVGQDGADLQAVFPIERQYVIVNERRGAFRILTCMQKAKRIGAVGGPAPGNCTNREVSPVGTIEAKERGA